MASLHLYVPIPTKIPTLIFLGFNSFSTSYATRKQILSLLLLLLLSIHLVFSVNIEAGEFNSFAFIGRHSTSNEEPSQILVTKRDDIYVAGTTSPLERNSESDLGQALVPGLRREDFFLAKISGEDGSAEWVYRGGTSKEDRLQAILLDNTGNFLYVAGRTFGQFSGTSKVGQSDIFVIKYDISGQKPTELWSKPLVVGSKASESVTSLAQDPSNEDVIYGTGFTSGNLFPGKEIDSNGLSDGILFSFSAKSGTVLHKQQFGTQHADQGTGIVISEKANGPVFVSVITERQIGQYAFGNFHMYKFTRNAEPLGDLLLRTYSREQMASFRHHPMLPGTLIASGSSWLDSRNGYDVFVKRVNRAFDVSNIGSTEMDIDEVGNDEYTKRIPSTDGGHDYASGMIIDPDSGRLIVSGYTAGTFAPGSAKTGILAPFVAAIDPTDASLTDARQMKLESSDSWVEISCVTMAQSKNGLYYVAKESNSTTNQFHLVVGSFGFPSSWKTQISIAPSPDPTPSPKTGDQDKNSALQKKKLPLGIIIGSAVGGVVFLVIVIVVVICLMKRGSKGKKPSKDKKEKGNVRSKTETKNDRGKGQRPKTNEGEKVEGGNASGLV